ncbi:MAG: phospho-N-acetylmuramoyl-pentapeptide-transferase [Verrucomicrobiota bacterium]
MLYYLHLLKDTHELLGPLRLFEFLTFRAVGAASTALLLSLILGPVAIRLLTRLKLGQPLRTKEEVNKLADLHGGKRGTPTMGGILVIGAVVFSSLLWSDLSNAYVWLTIFAIVWLGALGFWDDYTKVALKNSAGISGKTKLAGQLLLAVIVAAFLYWHPAISDHFAVFHVPFVKARVLETALFETPWLQIYIFCAVVFYALVIMGTSNAVNLTDGLDGLAIGCTCSVAVVYGAFCYVTGTEAAATYLQLPYVAGADEVTIFMASLFGAGLGFLWYNCHPAKVFMGDTGSLSIGGAIAVVAIIVHQELLLVLAGGVFVMEAGSVMLQVFWFKTRKKRLFAMSPIHHHFELKGWNESTVTIRFWILGILFALLALSTLKIR